MRRKQKILLINPWITDFAAYDFWLRPLGLLRLAAALRNAGFAISYIDCLNRSHRSTAGIPLKKRKDGTGHFLKTEIPRPEPVRFVPRTFSRYGVPVEAFESDLAALPRPDAVMTACSMTYWYPGAAEAISIVKKHWPVVPVVLGGRYATLCPDHARENSGADFVIEGYWESTVPGLLAEIFGETVELETDFRDCSPPAHDISPDRSVAAISLSRGCPFSCTYCVSRLLNPRFEQRSTESVKRELEFVIEKSGARHIAFYDDALLANADQLFIPVLRFIIERGYKANFYTPNALHARFVTAEIATLMKTAGFKEVRLGYESSDAGFQSETGGKVTTGEFERAARALLGAGFRPPQLGAYIILGHPAQTEDSVRDAIRAAASLGVDPVLAEYSPIPGSLDFEAAVRAFNYRPDADPLLQNSSIARYQHPAITTDGFERLKQESSLLRKKLKNNV